MAPPCNPSSGWLQDLQVVLDRDPAARSLLEVLLCYPGLHALWGYRVAHWLWQRRFLLLARLLSGWVRVMTGVDIHPGARIGCRCFIDHGMGLVIGETAVIGHDVTLYQGVTLGGTGKEKGRRRHPVLRDGVLVGSGAAVLGPIVIGEGAVIGANSVVLKDVPAHATVVGVPVHKTPLLDRLKHWQCLPTDDPDPFFNGGEGI